MALDVDIGMKSNSVENIALLLTELNNDKRMGVLVSGEMARHLKRDLRLPRFALLVDRTPHLQHSVYYVPVLPGWLGLMIRHIASVHLGWLDCEVLVFKRCICVMKRSGSTIPSHRQRQRQKDKATIPSIRSSIGTCVSFPPASTRYFRRRLFVNTSLATYISFNNNQGVPHPSA